MRRCSADSIHDRATALGRDCKNVHQDMVVLEATGLLIREGRGLLAPWDEVKASVNLAAS